MNLQKCGANVGDTVRCTSSSLVVSYKIGKEYLVSKSTVSDRLVIDSCMTGASADFVVVSRGWLTEEPEGSLDCYDISYYMGVAIAWRKQPEPEPVIEVIEKRMSFETNNRLYYPYHSSGLGNSTLKGVTKYGKPVGVWTITLDAD